MTSLRSGRAIALGAALLLAGGWLALRAPSGDPSPAGPSGPRSGSIASPADPSETAPSPAPSLSEAGRSLPLAGLVTLAGRPGATRLERWDDAGLRHEVQSPSPDAAWISAAPNGTLLVTLRDGRAFVGHELDPGAWRELGPTVLRGRPVAIAFGTLDPSGRQAAFLAAEPGRAGSVLVIVIGLAASRDTVVATAGEIEGAAPAWLPDGRLALPLRDRSDRPRLVILDPGSGRSAPGPAPVRAVAVDPGERLAAVAGPLGEGLALVAAGPFLAGASPSPAATIHFASGRAIVPGSLAFDASGDRLAVAWTIDGSARPEIRVYGRAADWAEIGRVDLAASDELAVVGWLR